MTLFRKRQSKDRQWATEPNLTSVVSNTAITFPPHRLVESDPAFITLNSPNYRFIITVGNEMTKRERGQRLADAEAPIRGVNGDGIEFP